MFSLSGIPGGGNKGYIYKVTYDLWQTEITEKIGPFFTQANLRRNVPKRPPAGPRVTK